jgi:hypothetical protein
METDLLIIAHCSSRDPGSRYPYLDHFLGARYRLKDGIPIYLDAHSVEYYVDNQLRAHHLNGTPYPIGNPQTHHWYSLSKHERRRRRVLALRMQTELGLL